MKEYKHVCPPRGSDNPGLTVPLTSTNKSRWSFPLSSFLFFSSLFSSLLFSFLFFSSSSSSSSSSSHSPHETLTLILPEPLVLSLSLSVVVVVVMEKEGGEVETKRGEGFPLTGLEVALAMGVVATFGVGLLGVYWSMPDSDYSFLKLPRTLEDLQNLRDHLEVYATDYTIQVLVTYCTVYIFMQTFMIPGTIFMSLLAGSLFGVLRGVALVVFAATAGASSCYFLSKMVGRPLVFSLWPDKICFFQTQVANRREKLLNYMLFLRVTPALPNTFINMASPIVDVPYHIFLLATSIGLIPAAYVTVKAGVALGELRSLEDLYDFQSIATLFFIGIVSITPTLMSKNQE